MPALTLRGRPPFLGRSRRPSSRSKRPMKRPLPTGRKNGDGFAFSTIPLLFPRSADRQRLGRRCSGCPRCTACPASLPKDQNALPGPYHGDGDSTVPRPGRQGRSHLRRPSGAQEKGRCWPSRQAGRVSHHKRHVCARRWHPSPSAKSLENEVFGPRPGRELWQGPPLWQHVCARKPCRWPKGRGAPKVRASEAPDNRIGEVVGPRSEGRETGVRTDPLLPGACSVRGACPA